jgi:hypothetical protein
MLNFERSPTWRRVEEARTVRKKCPRCHNEVDFFLGSDTALGIAIFTFVVVSLKNKYALKCPICIHYDEIDKIQARVLMK